jgi:hypothetical protein
LDFCSLSDRERARVREKLMRATLTSLLSLQKEGEDVLQRNLRRREERT